MAYKTGGRKRRSKKKLKLPVELPVLLGALCAAVTALIAVALTSFNAHDESWFYYSSDPQPVANKLGLLGSYSAAALFYYIGNASFLLVPLLLGVAIVALNKKKFEQQIDRFIAGIVALLCVTVLLHVYKIGSIGYMVPGGIVGKAGFTFLRQYLDLFLLKAVLWVAVFACCIVILRMSFLALFERLFQGVYYVLASWRHWLLPVFKVGSFIVFGVLKLVQQVVKIVIFSFQKLCAGTAHNKQEEHPFALPTEQQFEATMPQPQQEYQEEKIIKTATIQDNYPLERKKQRHSTSRYKVPSQELFDPSEKQEYDQQTSYTKELAGTLEEKLLRFGVAGKVVNIKPGPVITLFEYQPEIDAKVSKIVGLEQDLALALHALSVRIIAPIPGTPLVGFEVANKKRLPVYLRDIIRSSAFTKSRAALPIVLGKDTTGSDVVVDLIDMPHLLVAGSTGSGKSVALNTLLMSLLCKLSPDELKLVIIDPKRLEFAQYHDIAHLLFPVITQPHKAAPVLKWLVKTMEERYEMMAERGARSIFDYKQQCQQSGEVDELPFIVLMIDELADLMMVARKEIEDNIARLAQMARAAGIYLVVATQRPSVDVLTGIIKVNFPSRISFRVSSKVDSRTILDALGAETLLGKGDMLFIDAHSSRMRRVHGAYVTDTEIAKVVAAIKAQQEPDYVSLEQAVADYHDAQDSQDEPLLAQVVEYLRLVDEISISLLQRKFKIGYNRSARLMEILESQGRIMPADGSKMRKVIH